MEKKTSLVQEFKTFISRGNVIDLAVGIIIGSSFTGIVNSLVKDLIMPSIGVVLGNINLSDYKIVLQLATVDVNGKILPEVAIAYGAFLQNIINFIIVAAVVFALVKMINAVQKKDEKKEVDTKPKESELSVLKDIREALKKR
jgi:large conductance mechanosensitive channel